MTNTAFGSSNTKAFRKSTCFARTNIHTRVCFILDTTDSFRGGFPDTLSNFLHGIMQDFKGTFVAGGGYFADPYDDPLGVPIFLGYTRTKSGFNDLIFYPASFSGYHGNLVQEDPFGLILEAFDDPETHDMNMIVLTDYPPRSIDNAIPDGTVSYSEIIDLCVDNRVKCWFPLVNFQLLGLPDQTLVQNLMESTGVIDVFGYDTGPTSINNILYGRIE